MEIDAHFADSSYRLRLRNSGAICVNAARSIPRVLNHILENNASFSLHSLYSPLISIYALAIHLVKSPHSGNAKTDLEVDPPSLSSPPSLLAWVLVSKTTCLTQVLASASQIIRCYEKAPTDGTFSISTTVTSLASQVSSRVHSSSRAAPGLLSSRDSATNQIASSELGSGGSNPSPVNLSTRFNPVPDPHSLYPQHFDLAPNNFAPSRPISTD